MKKTILINVLLIVSAITACTKKDTHRDEVRITQLKVYKHSWQRPDGSFYKADTSLKLYGAIMDVNSSPITEVKQAKYPYADYPILLKWDTPLSLPINNYRWRLTLLSEDYVDSLTGAMWGEMLDVFFFSFTDPEFKTHPASVTYSNDTTIVEMDLKWY